jgi:phage shock protein PspC (stress-responsive transcriptional regulator)
MNKTIIINISGVIFHIEEEAYEKLKLYMTEVKLYFSKSDDSFEIVNDIENRIAELFSDIIRVEEKEGINMLDVEKVIRTMGKPADFEQDLKEEELDAEAQKSFIKKRLYRNPDDKIAGGVCSGIAAYFNTDPLWVRLLLAISIFFFGTGIALYLILWLIMPEAITRTEKLAMRGESPTLESIRKSVEEEINSVRRNMNGDQASIKSFISSLFETAIGVLKILVRLFGKFLGLMLMLSAIGILIGFTIALFSLLGFADSEMMRDFPLFMLREDNEQLMYFAWYFSIALPAVAALLLGIKVLFNTNPFNKVSGFTMLSVWLLCLFTTIYYTVDTLSNFKEEGRLQESKLISASSANKYYLLADDEFSNSVDSAKTMAYGVDNKMVLKQRHVNFGLDNVRMNIQKSTGPEMKLVTIYYGRGRTEKEAIASASTIVYNVEQRDSVLIFPREFKLKDRSTWRKQEIEMILFVPYDMEIIVDEKVDWLTHNIYSGDCEKDVLDRVHWKMGKDGMECTKKAVEIVQ